MMVAVRCVRRIDASYGNSVEASLTAVITGIR
jgi:hypothetical protein